MHFALTVNLVYVFKILCIYFIKLFMFYQDMICPLTSKILTCPIQRLFVE